MEKLLHNPSVLAEENLSTTHSRFSGKENTLQHLLHVCVGRLRGLPRSIEEVNYSLQMLSTLREMGWHKSLRSRKPVQAQGKAIPWYTYAAFEWLALRVKPTDVVFEFGAGNSTVWFGNHAKQVVSVEHDARWIEEVRSKVSGNVTLLARNARLDAQPSNGNSPYVAALERFAPGTFDIIVIDGVERVACAEVAPASLKKDGIIIFDDSHRPAYKHGIDHLHQQGFGRVDFYGFASQIGLRSCTSVFSRPSSRWTAENIPLIFQGA